MEQERERPAEVSFDRLLLGGVILLMVTLISLAAAFYVVPSENLEIAVLQPVIRVSREADFPVGSSRVRNWGDRAILVMRPNESEYFALQGESPADGCILRWDPESFTVYSPCRFLIYDLRGDVVAGLSTQALRRYPVSLRDGVVYVADPERQPSGQ